MADKTYLDIFSSSFKGYARYLYDEITQPSWNNYFYWFIGLSVLVFLLELIVPWRKDQKHSYKGFLLDLFYLVFNFFLFSLVGYAAVADVAVAFFTNSLSSIGITNLVAVKINTLPAWLQLFILFIITDFIQFNIHRLLHRVPFLWRFHKVHHSVKTMGFAAQFRFHFMETIVYKSIQYLPLAMIGFGIDQFIIVHMFAFLIGHLNHANLNWNYGIFKYVFNNPQMHLWHHAKKLPAGQRYGVNYGLSLSLWDYLFGTAHIPYYDPDLELGFKDDEQYPQSFTKQIVEPFK